MPSRELRDKIEKLIMALSNAKRVRPIYGENHKITKEAVDNLYNLLKDILAEKEEITIGIVGNEIAFEKEPFYEASKKIKNFIDYLKEIKAEKISFAKGVQPKELAEFVTILTVKPKDLGKTEGIQKIFDSSNIRNIAIGKIGFKKEEAPQGIGEEELKSIAGKNYQNGINFLTETLESIEKNQPINIKSARQFVSTIVTNLLKNKNLLLILTSTKSHDESTFVHDINVAVFTLLQAEALGLEQNYLNDIGVAALLHDAGKLSIGEEVLKKKGKLDKEELEQMRLHPANGAKILLESPDINVLAAIAAFEHHIQYDMAGYPKRPFNKKINFVSMMVAIADYYDAVRSRRYYHKEMAPEKTYQDMTALSGKDFHPDLLNNFFNIIGIYPPGTLIELDTKEIGLVVKGSTIDIKRPHVEILYNSNGEKEKNPYIVNLLEKDKNGNYKRTVKKSIIASDKVKVPDKYL